MDSGGWNNDVHGAIQNIGICNLAYGRHHVVIVVHVKRIDKRHGLQLAGENGLLGLLHHSVVHYVVIRHDILCNANRPGDIEHHNVIGFIDLGCGIGCNQLHGTIQTLRRNNVHHARYVHFGNGQRFRVDRRHYV
jgi:hypothetical protein